MALTTVFFVFLFLPLSLILYRFIPQKYRNLTLLLLSLLFIAWGHPADLILIGLSVVFNYFTALELDGLLQAGRNGLKKWVLATGIAANLALLVFFKYFVFFLENVGALIGVSYRFTVLAPPIGISFFTFSAISCLCDVAKGNERAVKNPLDFALYITFFAKITSGPIVRFRDMAKQLTERRMTVASVEKGLRLFLFGLSKKVILAGSLGFVFHSVRAQELGSLSALGAWLGALSYSLMLYFDFSGYSDMAIGLGHVFGFSFAPNFDHPYASGSMTEFWRRWHISLGAWFRDYVYIPLGGSRVGRARHLFNLSMVWVLTGLWHGANWTFVVWGVYHLALLLAEKFLLAGALQKIPSVCRKGMTFLGAVIGWVIFFSDDIAYAGRYLLKMIGIGGSGLADRTGLYLLHSGWIILAIALIGASGLPNRAVDRLKERIGGETVLVRIVTTVFLALLLIGSTAFMISDTVTSFLYAKF